MKAAVMKEGGGLEVQDVPEPGEPGPDRVKVKIAYCGICGSELHSLDPEYTSRPPQFRRPTVEPIWDRESEDMRLQVLWRRWGAKCRVLK